jgi:hypothetical protein
VTDLPADFETFADAVDADLAGLLGGTTGQVLKKTSNSDHAFAFGVDPTFDLVTTAGDLVYGTAADTMARLGIGTAGQILTVNSGATAPEWAAAPASGGFDLLSTTTLSGASVSINVSSAYKHLQVLITGVYASGNVQIIVRPNNNSTAADYYIKQLNVNGTTLSADQFNGATQAGFVADIGSSSTATLTGFLNFNFYDYNSANGKYVEGSSFTKEVGLNHWTRYHNGVFFGTAITSFTILTGSGTFSGGTVKIYGAK